MQSVARTISLIGMVLFTSETLISNYSLAESSDKSKNKTAAGQEILIPDAGLRAHMQGLEVILKKDGTWHLQDRNSLGAIIAVTDTGDTVKLRFSQDEKGQPIRTWEYYGNGAGPIQIVVNDAVSTAKSPHSQDDNCIPTIKIRNLSKMTMENIVIEIEFESTSGQKSGVSVMAGPLDHGEEKQINGPALLVESCAGLTGYVTIPYCVFSNEAPCSPAVKTSEFGVIPLKRLDNNSEGTTVAR
jgi:hypothetical protein